MLYGLEIAALGSQQAPLLRRPVHQAARDLRCGVACPCTEQFSSVARRLPMSKAIKMFVRVFLWSGTMATAWADDSALTRVDSSNVPWSFRPLPVMELLSSASNSQTSDSASHPIDRYIHRRLEDNHLAPGRRAAAHRQVRRLSLMLTGLPPDPGVVSEFVANPTDDQYAALTDRYLQSPQFGERWARHWMDVVRYAETWGYEWNHLVRGAWRYRDYLIRAFNQDLPYDQLIREHIAGDLFDNPRVNESLGINESLIGGAFYRFGETGHDDCVLYPNISLDVMDNQIDTLSKAFQALTVSCSRCHDHKLDEIPQRDYYGLLGIIASSRQVIRTLDLPHRQDELKEELTKSKHQIRQVLADVWRRESEDVSAKHIGQLIRTHEQEAKPNGPTVDDSSITGDGMEQALFAWRSMTNLPKGKSWQDQWDEIQQTMREEHQRRVAFNRENYILFGDFTNNRGDHPEWGFEGLSMEDRDGIVPAGDFSVRPEGPHVIHGVLPAGLFSHTLSQKLNAAVRSPLLPENRKYVSYQSMGERNSVCRTVIANCTLPFFHSHRFTSPDLTWTTVDLKHIRKSPLVHLKSYLEWATALDDQGYPVLQTPHSDYQEMLDNPRSYFGLTKVFVHDVDQPPLQELQGPLLVFEFPVSNTDELADRYREILIAAIARWSKREATETDVYWLNSFLDLDLLSRQQRATAKLDQLVAEYRALEERIETPKRIVGMADQDEGFDVPLLAGGNASSPVQAVQRAYLTQIEPLISNKPARTGSGRQSVAELIANPENPLTARVMANRIWHYLMGSGIVRSVDNFGNLGDPPSHPELLDYLARRLVDSGWSVKTVIREIVLSNAFRQSSTVTVAGERQDPENRLFHRFVSRRLEAEAIRDSLLAVSGRLDPTMFGPSVDPYRQEEIDLRRLYVGPLDGEGRRSIYLKVTRMGPSKLLELYNFPDPSVTRGRRDSTNVPSQALGLLNHPFVHQQAELNAKRLLNETGPSVTFESMLERLFMDLFSRPPDEIEQREYAKFFNELASAHDVTSFEAALENEQVWKDLIHTLYNLKEFVYVL
jgi:hypothetical protein